MARLLPAIEPDTVVHCGILWYPEPGKPARALHDINVIGTLQLLAACERTPALRAGRRSRLGARSTAARAPRPSFFTEEMARRLPLRTRFQRDASELEAYFDNFARRHPEVACCTLRYQPEIGADLDSPLVRYLSLPVVPVQLGFDPRLQLVHADDADGALEAAVRSPVRGCGQRGSDRRGLADQDPAPRPPPRGSDSASARSGPRSRGWAASSGPGALYGDGVRLLRFGRGVDNGRLGAEVGFEPSFDALGAVEDFVGRTGGRRVGPPAPRRAASPAASRAWGRERDAAEA